MSRYAHFQEQADMAKSPGKNGSLSIDLQKVLEKRPAAVCRGKLINQALARGWRESVQGALARECPRGKNYGVWTRLPRAGRRELVAAHLCLT